MYLPSCTDKVCVCQNESAHIFLVSREQGHSIILQLSPPSTQMIRTDVCCLREIQNIAVQLYPWQQAVGEQSRNGKYSYTCYFCSSISILGLKVTRGLVKKQTIMSCPYWQGHWHSPSQGIRYKNMYLGVGKLKYDII